MLSSSEPTVSIQTEISISYSILKNSPCFNVPQSSYPLKPELWNSAGFSGKAGNVSVAKKHETISCSFWKAQKLVQRRTHYEELYSTKHRSVLASCLLLHFGPSYFRLPIPKVPTNKDGIVMGTWLPIRSRCQNEDFGNRPWEQRLHIVGR